MARKPSIDTNTIISLVDQFYLEKCNNDPSQLKASKIGEYMRSLGYNIQDYTIRRNEEVANHIKAISSDFENMQLNTVAVFRDTDVDAFIALNNTKDKLKEAIRAKDNYYREVSKSAAYCFKEHKKMQTQVRNLQERVDELETLLEVNNTKASNMNSDNRAYKAENQKLRKIIYTYVYPEIANELLKKQGLLVKTADMADAEVIEKETLSADSDISELKSNVIKGLFESI